MVINLYTVRIVLKALGAEDYGIYNVVAGVITMLASFSSVFASATQRFYSYALGEGKIEKLQKIFSASTNIYLAVSIISIIVGETLGLWFVNEQLVIPSDRMIAANWIYQFALISFMVSMLSTPYFAASIAHEDMGIFAVITFVDALFKLFFAFAIPYIPIDKLVFYGLSLLIIQVFSYFCYLLVCRKRYPECRYSKVFDLPLHKEILAFSSWTLFSSFAVVGMNQVITILINLFFGPVVNAARAIAIQVNSALSTFCNSFIMAIRPPMIKAYAEGNIDYLNKVFLMSTKFTYFCMLMIAIPLILEMDIILKVWLGEISMQTVVFCRWMVVYGVILSLCNPITIIVQATGRIKRFTIPVETVTMLTPIVVYVMFKVGLSAESSFIAMVVMATIAHVVRLFCLKAVYTDICIKDYVMKFCIPALVVTLLVVPICYWINLFLTNSELLRFLIVCVSSVILVLIATYLVGIDNIEKNMIKKFLHIS